MSRVAHTSKYVAILTFPLFGNTSQKNQFANYLPTLGLAGQHYTQGDKRQRISRFPSQENCHLKKILVPGPVGWIRLLAADAEPIFGQE